LAVNFIVAAGLTAPLVLLVPFSAHVFGAAAVGPVLLALTPSNLISALAGWQESLVLRTGKLKTYYGVLVASEVLAGVVALVLLTLGYGLYALVAQIYVRNTAGLLGYLPLGATRFSERFSVGKTVEVMRWSVSRYLSVVLNFASTYGADIILGLLLSPAAAGLYRASNRIVTAVSDVIVQPARMIAMSAFSALAADGRGAEREWASFTTIAAVCGWSALGGLAVCAPMLVPLLLGPQWSGAAAIVPILCAARATVLLDALSGTMLVTYNRQRALFALQVAGTGITLAALLLSSRHGLVMASFGVLAASAATSLMILLYAWRAFPASAAEFRAQAPMLLAPVVATVLVAQLAMGALEARPFPAAPCAGQCPGLSPTCVAAAPCPPERQEASGSVQTSTMPWPMRSASLPGKVTPGSMATS
jgi:O-antigen/teichoic acid export membrane protein